MLPRAMGTVQVADPAASKSRSIRWAPYSPPVRQPRARLGGRLLSPVGPEIRTEEQEESVQQATCLEAAAPGDVLETCGEGVFVSAKRGTVFLALEGGLPRDAPLHRSRAAQGCACTHTTSSERLDIHSVKNVLSLQ